jgi:hypothetical protein
MVSLSSNESLKNMVENYGFGTYLFSQLNDEQLDHLFESNEDFREYLEMLFSGKIYDPASLAILSRKYDQISQEPNLFELEVSDFVRTSNDIDIFQAELLNFANEQLNQIKITEIRNGDVVYLYSTNPTDRTESYYIYSYSLGLQNVYFRFGKTEIIEPIKYMDILGSTPVNYWNHLKIPNLCFEFDLQLVFEKIHWSKIKVENQDYLIGEFVNQKKKVYLLVPIQNLKSSANKIAVSLQISTKKLFLTTDPKGIIPGSPDVFFANLDMDSVSLPTSKEPIDEDEE